MALLPTDGVLQPGEAIRSVFLGPLNSPEVGAQVTLSRNVDGKDVHRHVYVAFLAAGDDVAAIAKAWCEAYGSQA